MSRPRIFAYNPDLLTSDEVKASFVARGRELADVLEDLRHARPEHRLFFGPRGMGKTTLLRRIAIGVDDDDALSSRWIPLTFSEEQYGVGCLGDVWLNCLDALADRAQRAADTNDARDLDARIDELARLEPQRRARDARAELERRAHGRGYVLLVDNLDLLLSRLSDDEQWALRESLGTGRLAMIGASVGRPEATYTYGKPLYELFRATHLGGLDDDETRDLLALLSERRGTPDVTRILEQQPGRIAALRILSGGNARALVLVHQILARHGAETALDDVEALLDVMTPLYKARFEALSSQQQSIVDAVALAFDPITSADVAERVRLPVKHVSAVLGRLAEDGTLERRTLPRGKIAFLVSERLFNIWYLMRANRRARRSLTWLVRFYEGFYGAGSAEDLAGQILERAQTSPREAELLLACALALPPGASRRKSEVRAIEALIALGRTEPGLDLGRDDRDLAPLVDRMKTLREIRALLADAPPIGGVPTAELVAGAFPLQLVERLAISRKWKREGEFGTGVTSLLQLLAGSDNRILAKIVRSAASGVIGDPTTIPDDLGAVEDDTAGVMVGTAWKAGASSGTACLEAIRARSSPVVWWGAISGACETGHDDVARRWLQTRDGEHRNVATAVQALMFGRGESGEALLFELAAAAIRQSEQWTETVPIDVAGQVLVGIWSGVRDIDRLSVGETAVKLRAAIDSGTGPELIEILASGPDAERIRPVLEAARAAVGDGSLEHLAPEIREPAAHMLRFFRMKIERWDFAPVPDSEKERSRRTRTRTTPTKPKPKPKRNRIR